MRVKRNSASCSQYQSEDRLERLRNRSSLSCSFSRACFCEVMSVMDPVNSTAPSASFSGIEVPNNQRSGAPGTCALNSHCQGCMVCVACRVVLMT